ncbi:MAG: AraC family transcriptional regulator [Burkholderiales bacterium]|nr:AraC family transcriptional regulator [Burkholderiales bacterium]
MIDPLAEVVGLLRPGARYSKVVVGAGAWRVRRADAGLPFYAVVLEGACQLTVDSQPPLALQAGDFVLVPAAQPFTNSSATPPAADVPDVPPTQLPDGTYRVGDPDGPPDVRLLVGHCTFGSPDAALLVSLLPQLVHVRGEPRLTALVQLLIDETRAGRPARDEVLARLLEVLLIEVLRSTRGTAASPGLVRGLADARLAAALRAVHEQPARAWTIEAMAKEAALSRSAFFERFSRAVGVAPMSYLLAWRMALARKLLRDDSLAVADVAERVGYSSASTFSVAFTRHAGQPPARYGRSA